MDKQKRKSQQDKQRKEKIRKLFQNSVGVTASATAVVVATPLFDNVTAEFNDFKLLEDSIYYEVDVIEEVGEEGVPNGRPLRLVIENQWERIEVPLEYGVNADVLSELRPNANYDFTVQMDKGVTWVTLANQQVTTEDELAGVIGPASYDVRGAARQVELEVLTQSGGVAIQFYQLALIKDGQTISQTPIVEGTQTVNFELPLDNASWQLELQAITAESELIVLDDSILIPPGHFDTSFSVQLIGPKEALIQPLPDLNAFTEQVYLVDIIENGVLIDTVEATSDFTAELEAAQSYQFVFYVNYIDDRTEETFQEILAESLIETPEDLFYLLNVIEHETETEYLLQVENYDTWFTDAFIRYVRPDGSVVSTQSFERVSTVGSTTLFRINPLATNGIIEIGLTLNQTSQSELIIQRIGD